MAVAAPAAPRTDSLLQTSVLQELRWDTGVKQTDVGVEVKDGVVTLTGMVDSLAEKLAAEKAAHRVYGVRYVANDLSVKAFADGQPTDTDIAQSVRAVLLGDALIPEDRILTTVTNGIVRLEGAVPLWRQREYTERAISRLRGVRSVLNLLTVAPDKIDPAFVRKEIENALDRQAEREARNIQVEVKDGTLKLSGKVRTWNELRAIREVASHAPGVHTFEDNLHIDPRI